MPTVEVWGGGLLFNTAAVSNCSGRHTKHICTFIHVSFPVCACVRLCVWDSEVLMTYCSFQRHCNTPSILLLSAKQCDLATFLNSKEECVNSRVVSRGNISVETSTPPLHCHKVTNSGNLLCLATSKVCWSYCGADWKSNPHLTCAERSGILFFESKPVPTVFAHKGRKCFFFSTNKPHTGKKAAPQ